MVLLITGSSASGKTTIGRLLSQRKSFHLIDGDEVLKELGLKSSCWNTIHHELLDKSLEKAQKINTIISHVVLPSELELYKKSYKYHRLDFKTVILRPSKETLIKRSKNRTCFSKTTPKSVISHFYSQFSKYPSGDKNVLIIDNSLQTAEDTIKQIIDWLMS